MCMSLIVIEELNLERDYIEINGCFGPISLVNMVYFWKV